MGRMPPEPWERFTCQACGTWECSACGWRRSRASRFVVQVCGRCGSTDGTMLPIRHTGRGAAEDHDEWFARQVDAGRDQVYAP